MQHMITSIILTNLGHSKASSRYQTPCISDHSDISFPGHTKIVVLILVGTILSSCAPPWVHTCLTLERCSEVLEVFCFQTDPSSLQ